MTALPCQHCHHLPTYHHVEAQEQPYRGTWQAIVARIADLSPDVPVYKRELDRWLREIWAEQPDAKAAVAVNTTLLGREGEVRA